MKSETFTEEDKRIVRTVNVASDLFDVSVVTKPAYPESEAGLRSEDAEDLQKALDAWRAGKNEYALFAIEREAKLIEAGL